MSWKRAAGAIADAPNQVFHQVDQLMLEDPLHGLQPVGAFEAANLDDALRRIVARAEGIEEHAGGNGDFVTGHTQVVAQTRGTAAIRRHARRQSKREQAALQRFAAAAFEEPTVVGAEQPLQVCGMDRGEIRRAHV